ncbi:MAG: hypothetical protein H6734_15785 [Alphaproteobacteria bacterium]|nr:hypothetical protein [Alphaproteobacteria bacterium]
MEIVTTILADERVHATWTWRGLCVLAGDEATALAVYAPIRAAEARGSRRILRHLLPAFEARGARPTHPAARLRWAAMKLAAHTGLAVPELPTLPFPHPGGAPCRMTPTTTEEPP